jgi:hypothetical protein
MSKITSGLTTHTISADETGNSTKVLLTSSATYTGAWEDVTEFATVAVAIKGDNATDGTLYIESSQDGGTVVNSVPYAVSDASFDLPHIWNVVESHIRVRYVNGTTAQTGHFQMQTKYSNGQELGLLQDAGDTITADTDVQVTKAILAGEELDDLLELTGTYGNVNLLANDALHTAIPPDVLYQKKRPTDPAIPSGSAITIHATLNVEANVLDSGWIAVKSFGGGSLINVITDVDLSIYVMNASDTSGNNIQGNSAPSLTATGGRSATIGAAFFDDYFRVVVENTSGASANAYSIRATGNQVPATPVFNSLDQPIFGFFPAPLNRSVSVGKDSNGNYVNTPSSGVDNNNTTSSPLDVSGVFTGTWTEVDLYSEIRMSYDADVNGVSCYAELSPDGATVERQIPLPPQPNTLQSNFGAVHTLNPVLPYFRIVYTNGTTGQTTFNLTTILSTTSGGGLISRSTQTLNKYNDVSLQRVINTPSADRNFGLLNYQQAKRQSGKNSAVGNGAFETIWSYSADWIPTQVAETIRIASGGNINDTAAGTGARSIEITFLDNNWEEVTETLVTAGASASSATTATCYRVQKVKVLDVGTYHGSNAGDIVIENSTTGDILGFIEGGVGVSEQSICTVPADHTMYITEILVSVGQGDSADVRLVKVPNADDFTTTYSGKIIDWSIEDYSGASPFSRPTFLKFDQKTDVWFEAIRQTGSGNARVSVDFSFILVDDTI